MIKPFFFPKKVESLSEASCCGYYFLVSPSIMWEEEKDIGFIE